MEHIIDGLSTVFGVLGKPRKDTSKLRLIKYCIPLETEDGVLLYNTLTRQMVLLTPEEYANALILPALREQWFTIPETMDEKELVELVRWTRETLRREPKHITQYTILTTTDCNARCFYCYEKGCAKVTMTPETAQKVIAYIKANCGDNEVKINWFGGEPLMNVAVIDQICAGLRAEGISFSSTMVSNSYLFCDEIAKVAAKNWNLKSVQVTLDGTEPVYNRSKAYIYRQGSAYRVVLDNIDRMLNAGIQVTVRLNMDLYNGDDLLVLAEELASRFRGREKLRIYAHLLFDTQKAWYEHHTLQEWQQVYEKLHRLEEKLIMHGLQPAQSRRLKREPALNHCMADSGNSVVIVPDGHLGLCEHHTDKEFFGHIDSEERDKAVIASWRERREPIPECDDCPFYPECINLKKCNGRTACFALSLEARRREKEQAMRNEYNLWKKRGEES